MMIKSCVKANMIRFIDRVDSVLFMLRLSCETTEQKHTASTVTLCSFSLSFSLSLSLSLSLSRRLSFDVHYF